jgi:voltage-gated potassium channel
MATVGYGDTYPVSTQGRIVGTALMIMGVALLGTITASIASNFNMTNREDSVTGESLSDLEALKKRVTELEEKLDNQS